jgi:hypothetical protein
VRLSDCRNIVYNSCVEHVEPRTRQEPPTHTRRSPSAGPKDIPIQCLLSLARCQTLHAIIARVTHTQNLPPLLFSEQHVLANSSAAYRAPGTYYLCTKVTSQVMPTPTPTGVYPLILFSLHEATARLVALLLGADH